MSERTGKSSDKPATESVLESKKGPPFEMIKTRSVVTARHPVTSSVRFNHQAAYMIVTMTDVMSSTVRIVLKPGEGFLPEMSRESVNSKEKNAVQINTKLRSSRFFCLTLWVL